MNQNLFTILACAALSATFAHPAAAEDGPAAAPPEAGEGASAPVPVDPEALQTPAATLPGGMTPEYVAALRRISDERAAAATEAAEAEAAIGARRTAMAEENEEIGALVAEVADLEARLEDARARLQSFYEADEPLAALTARRDAARERNAAAQHRLQTAIAAAMQRRAALQAARQAGEPETPAPEPGE